MGGQRTLPWPEREEKEESERRKEKEEKEHPDPDPAERGFNSCLVQCYVLSQVHIAKLP